MPSSAMRRRSAVSPVPPARDDDRRAICRQVKFVLNSLVRRVDRRMQPLGLTGMQWEPVLMLWLKRAGTVAGLARAGGVGFASMSRMLDRLENRLVDGVLTIAASEHRAQLQNRAAARERLAAILRAAAAPPPPMRKPTKPTKGSKERRIAGKKRRAETKRGRSGSWD